MKHSEIVFMPDDGGVFSIHEHRTSGDTPFDQVIGPVCKERIKRWSVRYKDQIRLYASLPDKHVREQKLVYYEPIVLGMWQADDRPGDLNEYEWWITRATVHIACSDEPESPAAIILLSEITNLCHSCVISLELVGEEVLINYHQYEFDEVYKIGALVNRHDMLRDIGPAIRENITKYFK